MAKRVANNYLTRENWDEDDKGEEETGIFKKADEDVLKRRVIKRATRRMPSSTASGGGAVAFSKFGGLKAPSTTTSNVKNQFTIPDNKSTNDSTKTLLFSLGTSTDQKSSEAEDSSQNKENVSEYNRHLEALNKSVSDWISRHVEKNPMCDLSPVFKDYKKHLNQIEEKYLSSQSESSQSTLSDSQDQLDKPVFKLSGFETKTTKVDTKIEQASNAISIDKPLFSGFNTGKTSSPFTGFDIGKKGSSGVSFGSAASTTSSEDKQQKDDKMEAKKTDKSAEETAEGNSQPPVVNVAVIEEEGAIYTKKCKMFYSKEEGYVERGVGYIYLKKVENKTQLLMRADTSLGNILLNVILQSSMPTKRLGKNNVSLTCIPNPPINKEEPKLTTLLIRVKTSEDADELLKLMEENKSS